MHSQKMECSMGKIKSCYLLDHPHIPLHCRLTSSSSRVMFVLLMPLLPQADFITALDQPLARQIILNLYPPGEGISPHIDLPNRYADGIIGVSISGGTTMAFQNGGKRYDAYMPERTVYVMTGEARWEWSHGIMGRISDEVETNDGVETRLRSTRVSVTFRWMKAGAEVLD
jgi:alkylated DNA repair dioxygenase AlkB